MPAEIYKELCSRMMVPDSERMARIWEILCDEDDARLLLAMPGTVEDLAQKTGRTKEETERRIKDLFLKGVVFESPKPQGIVYRPARHLIQLHDASVQWPGATQEFYDTWKAFMAEEFPPLLAIMLSGGIPSFMRVIPAADAVAKLPDALLHEDVTKIIENAQELAVVKCPCRQSEKNCDNPVETCIQINNGARYNIKRGTGRPIDKAEALRIVKHAEEMGLVHTVENRAGLGNVLCNCCTCCCAIIKPYLKGPEFRPILAPSRFQAQVDTELCIGDTLCTDVCPVGAISFDEEANNSRIDAELCFGCGLCVALCPAGALTLKTVRAAEFIPS